MRLRILIVLGDLQLLKSPGSRSAGQLLIAGRTETTTRQTASSCIFDVGRQKLRKADIAVLRRTNFNGWFVGLGEVASL